MTKFDTSLLKKCQTWHERTARNAEAKAANLEQTDPEASLREMERATGHTNFANAIALAVARLEPKAPGVKADPETALPPIPEPKGFSEFWAAYPGRRKKSKGTARNVWVQKKCHLMNGSVVAALERLKKSHDWTKEGGEYIPGPEVWLRREGWNDDLGTIAAPASTTARTDPDRWKEWQDSQDMMPTPYATSADWMKVEFRQWLKGDKH